MFDIQDDLRELIVALRELRDELRKGQRPRVAAPVIQKEIE